MGGSRAHLVERRSLGEESYVPVDSVLEAGARLLNGTPAHYKLLPILLANVSLY